VVIAPLGATRRRHGTLAWGVFADAENPALVLESSLLAFKILVLQALYSLSDEQAEFQLRDRLSLMRFVALACTPLPRPLRAGAASSTEGLDGPPTTLDSARRHQDPS
jgi:hypothetical protein